MVTVRLNFYLVIAVKPPLNQLWIGKGRCEPGLDFWTGLPCSGGCWMGEQMHLDPYQEVWRLCEKSPVQPALAGAPLWERKMIVMQRNRSF